MNNNTQPNRVRGPSSALSSFLREHGINISNRSRRARREQVTQETAATQVNVNEEATTSVILTIDDDPMEGVEMTTAAAQSSSSTAETTGILYRPSSSKSSKKKDKKKKSNKKRNNDSDDDEDDDEGGDSGDDAFAPSSSRRAVASRARIVFCIQCKGRFARKLDDEDDERLVCPDCLSGATAKKKASARMTKQLVAIKKDTVPKEVLPSLQNLCIAVVAEYIDEVEALGFISEDSLEKLAKIICRNRKLNDRTARLFMEPLTRNLSLYDCTNMNEVSLYNIAQFCPRMEQLELIYCGNINDKVLNSYVDRLHFLKSLQLSGAFLISTKAWCHFFEKISERLEVFTLRHSARFDKKCIEALAKYCPNLKKLKLGHTKEMKSDWLSSIAKLEKLNTLELAWTETEHQFQTADVVDLLSKIGPQLTELSIKGGHELDNKLLSEGLLRHCHSLQKLSLEQCEKLTAKAMVEFLNSWSGRSLTHLDISRCVLFDDEVLKAIIRHSGFTLQHLNIHSLELLTPTGLELLGGGSIINYNEETAVEEKDEFKACRELIHLNCGFVRSVDDFVLQNVITHCPLLQNVQVWGCHLLTDTVKSKVGLSITGREMGVMQKSSDT